LLITPVRAGQENSKVSETYFNLTSADEQKSFWNLHSEEIKKDMHNEWEVLKVVSCAFLELVNKGNIPGYTPERLHNFKNLEGYRFNKNKVKQLELDEPIFSDIIKELSGCENSFVLKISSQNSELKYFVCLLNQSKIEIISAYIFEEGHWKKLK